MGFNSQLLTSDLGFRIWDQNPGFEILTSKICLKLSTSDFRIDFPNMRQKQGFATSDFKNGTSKMGFNSELLTSDLGFRICDKNWGLKLLTSKVPNVNF